MTSLLQATPPCMLKLAFNSHRAHTFPKDAKAYRCESVALPASMSAGSFREENAGRCCCEHAGNSFFPRCSIISTSLCIALHIHHYEPKVPSSQQPTAELIRGEGIMLCTIPELSNHGHAIARNPALHLGLHRCWQPIQSIAVVSTY